MVYAGGSATSATISGGGTVEFKTSGSSTIAISSGTLILDDSVHFSGTIAGLANATQKVDLADIAIATLQPFSYTDSGGSGTLTVTDGTHVAHLALIGSYVAGNFKTNADGGGGTVIFDPPISTGQAVATTS